ncbi:MAG: endonuclease [Chthoniobacteraceae bacterium]
MTVRAFTPISTSGLGALGLWLLSLLCCQAQYDAPTGYYDGAVGKTSTALKTALHSIVATHTVLPYTSTQPDVWDALKALDEDPADTSSVILIYSGLDALKANQYTGSNGTSGTWDREHLWPQSFGLVVYGDNAPPKTDIFNLRPIDPTINSARSNRYYDFSTAPVSTKTLAPGSDYDSDSWCPRLADRGQIARSIFYMTVVYNGSYTNAPTLTLSDTPNASTYTFGKLTTLLLWNRQYPVTDSERKRNQAVYDNWQHNRNPFIDNRYYADMMLLGVTAQQSWKNVAFTTTELSDNTISGDTADPDGDGISNLVEYAENLNPKTANSLSDQETIQTSGSALNLTHRKNRWATDLSFSYQISTDLQSWTTVTPSTTSTTHLDIDTDQVTVSVPMSGTREFIRVVITQTAMTTSATSAPKATKQRQSTSLKK